MSVSNQKEYDDNFKRKRSREIIFGGFLLTVSLLLFLSFFSFFFNWKADFSSINHLLDRDIESNNILKKIGSNVSHFFIYNLVGVSAFTLPILLFKYGVFLFFGFKIKKYIQRVVLGDLLHIMDICFLWFLF